MQIVPPSAAGSGGGPLFKGCDFEVVEGGLQEIERFVGVVRWHERKDYMTSMMEERGSDWPELPLAAWQDTYATLHRWTQIVGKTRLALAPMQNHWWQVTLYVTARGLGTSPMPVGPRSLEVDFDFLDHQLVARTSDGQAATMTLQPLMVEAFYRRYRDLLAALAVTPRI